MHTALASRGRIGSCLLHAANPSPTNNSVLHNLSLLLCFPYAFYVEQRQLLQRSCNATRLPCLPRRLLPTEPRLLFGPPTPTAKTRPPPHLVQSPMSHLTLSLQLRMFPSFLHYPWPASPSNHILQSWRQLSSLV